MTFALIIGTCDERLWGVNSRERIVRQLTRIGGIELVHELAAVPEAETVLLLRADYAYDLSTLNGLLRRTGLLMDGATPAAAHVARSLADATFDALANTTATQTTASGDRMANTSAPIPFIDARTLDGFEAELRKTEPPLLQAITPGSNRALEDRLYGISYKGITDFITKWWWPVPARAMVRWCANLGVAPNTVTLASAVLMLLVCWLFYEGQYFWGLLLGWFMTYLDTVDGKLARVTVQSSRFGHWLDHGMDILHPPFWYWLWGHSLAGFEPGFGLDFNTLVVLLIAGYIGGRLIEGAFHGLGSVSLFAWRPFDAWFRLVTARRNPCLLLLTAGWLLGEPGLGFELVVLWTLLSSVVLMGRLALACHVRLTRGALSSWLTNPEAQQRYPKSFQTFSSTRRAYG